MVSGLFVLMVLGPLNMFLNGIEYSGLTNLLSINITNNIYPHYYTVTNVLKNVFYVLVIVTKYSVVILFLLNANMFCTFRTGFHCTSEIVKLVLRS